ncbi:Chemotaxis regulator - transmits chemoreceptor signals to flagelllar motor components CheY [Dehalobacter sp. DCA]|nr:Chemotaxis regulator - transmits chemoreceptor signals to flagelllar motor components CheY [Dehalobacter sp. DCA]AFV05920.1 Chemotaxis regulator - transmits chemoreceptor signals to flagelllar motor components CheY [Dehalobacter sp. CF]
MVVDDSLFSRTLIVEILRDSGLEVVGEADSYDSLIETYDRCKPDIVTMDIVMPDMDGFECSRALFVKDPNAKIILVSSMKDEESEAEARRIGISGYIQKPVDSDYLVQMINNVIAPDIHYDHLLAYGLETFKESLTQNIARMTKSPVSFASYENFGDHYLSQGITAVIGLIGRHSGSMILDMSMETAERIVEMLLKRAHRNREEVLAMVAELANIIAGVACSMLNKSDKTYSLSVSPPSLFYGTGTEIMSPNLKMDAVTAETNFGNIFLGVGFKKGSSIWM